MLSISIPGRGELRLAHLTLDLNGTLALDGRLIVGVAERLAALRPQLELHVLTADTFGAATEIEAALGLSTERVPTGADKARVVERLGAESVVAVGNGTNDAEMLAQAALGIAVQGAEGLAREVLEAADLVAPDILAALDLLLRPTRLVATLRR